MEKVRRLREPRPCDYCRKQIEVGERAIEYVTKDRFGRVRYWRHVECEGPALCTDFARKFYF